MKAGKFLLPALAVSIAAIAAWVLHMRGDPLRKLERSAGTVEVVGDSAYAVTTGTGERRMFRDLVLRDDGTGPVRVTLSLPDSFGTEFPLPVVFILGGVEIGRRSLDYLEHHGANALFAYEYPYDPGYWYEGSPIVEISRVQRSALSVPSEVSATLRWAAGRPWADRRRFVLLGYSFGAMFTPAVYRVVERDGTDLTCGVIAYGGADLGAILEANLSVRPRFLRFLTARAAATALAPLEPSRHLPHLGDDMLLLNGRRDTKIPEASVTLLHDLKPAPKSVMWLDAGHMHPRLPELTREIAAVSRTWLVDRKAVAP